MDPWHEILENGGAEPETSEGSLIHLAYLLMLQLGPIPDIPNLAPPASKTAIENLTRTKYTNDSECKCPVCLKAIEAGETSITMPCKHEFHEECIMAWLKKTNSCPLCRYELPTDDPRYEEQREYKRREAQRKENVECLHNSMYS